MSNQPVISKEQGQTPTPLAQTNVEEILVLQTPLNEERNKKRDRETTTPASGPTGQPGTKRQRLNPLSEEEIGEETTDGQRDERVVSQQTFPLGGTSISSQRQELERQHSAEVSSLGPLSKEALDIKKTFTKIKSRMIH